MDKETALTVETTIDDKAVRNSPLFVNEVSKAHRKIEELEKRIAAAAEAESEKAKAAEQKKLEEAGKYKEILAQKESELAALRDKAARDVKVFEIKTNLQAAGLIPDPDVAELCASKFFETPDAPISDYVAKLKAEKPYLFATTTTPKGTPAPHVQPAAGEQSTHKQLLANLHDPKKAREASDKLTELYVKKQLPDKIFEE